MKTLRLIISAVLCISVSLASHAQDERQRGSSRKFEHTLTGTWQLCTLTPGQDQQPQLSLLPVLKVIGADYSFQHIGIPSEGACFIQKQGQLEKTSDSTFVEQLFTMKPDSLAKANTTYRFRMEGPIWLMIDYMEPGRHEPVSELWMRLRPQRQGKHRSHNGERPRAVGKVGKGKRPTGKIKSDSDSYNPFAKEDAADDDFE